MVDAVPNLHHQDSGQSFPRYTFEPAGHQGSLPRRHSERLRAHRQHRRRHAAPLPRALRRPVDHRRRRLLLRLRRAALAGLPRAASPPSCAERWRASRSLEDFDAYAKAGRKLSDLHVGYEQAEPYELDEAPDVDRSPTPKSATASRSMRFGTGKDRTTIIYNAHLTLHGIPERAYEYEVNGRPADRVDYRPLPGAHRQGLRASSTTRTRYSDDPRYIVDLLRRVVTVSLKTLDVTDEAAQARDEERLSHSWQDGRHRPVAAGRSVTTVTGWLKSQQVATCDNRGRYADRAKASDKARSRQRFRVCLSGRGAVLGFGCTAATREPGHDRPRENGRPCSEVRLDKRPACCCGAVRRRRARGQKPYFSFLSRKAFSPPSITFVISSRTAAMSIAPVVLILAPDWSPAAR